MTKKFSLFAIIFLAFYMSCMECSAETESFLAGEGTEGNPYLIQSAQDLARLRDSVNAGEGFADIYFQQTINIDLEGMPWEPIGLFGTDNLFEGYYDGAGHYVENLYIEREDNCAFFGVLAGTVMNLGIESGKIHGYCAASIAAHAYGGDAQIINCYNKAEVIGDLRAGGIVDNFWGTVCNCVNMGTLTAPMTGEVTSYNIYKAVFCYGISNNLYPPELFDGWGYNCGSFVWGVPETRLTVNQLNRNAYWLKQDALLRFGKLCYWSYSDGDILFADNDPYSDFKYAKRPFLMKIFCVFSLFISVGLMASDKVVRKVQIKLKKIWGNHGAAGRRKRK